MDRENEVKVLDVDAKKIKASLKQKGFEPVAYLDYKRHVYDTVHKDPDAWLRLRTDGNKTTITYKKFLSDSIDGTEEIEVEVADFDKMHHLIKSAGIMHKNYQENKRELYKKGDVEVSIDYWPRIPAYVEIEAPNKKLVQKALKELALEGHKTTSLSTQDIYKLYGQKPD